MAVLISLLITLLVIGLVLYLIQMLPIDARIKQLMYIVTVVFVIIWLLSSVGSLGFHRF